MLIIRSEQMTVMSDEYLVRQVVGYLREKHAEEVVLIPTGPSTIAEVPPETLHKMVRNGVIRARGHGLTWESSLRAFVVLMVNTAPNFDEHPHIQVILRDGTVEPDARLDQLLELDSEGDWDEARQNYDVSAWNLKPEVGRR